MCPDGPVLSSYVRFRLRPGDLLFNRTNSIDLVGRMAIIEDDRPAVFASYLVRLVVDVDRCIPEFLNYFMNWPRTQGEIKKLASRAVGQANINASKLRTVLFPLHAIDEQHNIAAILDAIDRKIDLHRQKRAMLEELFRALLHKLMTGEIRVGELDSSESPVHGQQEGAAYNGHFECVCYHPLFLFNQFGDCEGAKLRSGNVPSADDWQEVLDPVVERYFTAAVRLLFRADAAFAKPEIYEYLETRQIDYAIRLPANEVLQRKIAHLLTRPTEGPSPKPIVSYHDFTYQAQSWNVSRRVVAKVEWHQGELFPSVGFIVTNLSYPTIGIVRFYNGRGTAEQWIKEGKHALNWTRLSCHKFVANQVRLGLFIMAYNLGNFLRRLVLPESMKHWSLTSLQTRMIKTGGRLVRHARRLVFQLAEVLVSREMLCGILERIGRLRLAPG